ncbi:TsoY family (seleno)protein [Aliarcobacter butzleri]|uniref:TsoY family (seleno)protein n=1 Tax=Aliarcobacter butzleri TaxID=28197 RepID=UPI002B24A78B|nr:hypothetical protein [Aliarcobacter butzleri]
MIIQNLQISKNSLFFTLFLIFVFIINTLFSYFSYKELKNEYIFETKAEVLNIYPKEKFDVIKLKGDGFEFFASFSRLIINGDFDFTKNNNLTQMISIFALAMVAVGFSAPGAMSSNIAVNAVGIFGAILFSSLAIMLIFIKIILGFKNMFEHGVTVETAPSLWIMIPILTLLGITFIRLNFGLEHNLNAISDKSSLFVLTSTILSLQIVFGILGLVIMKKLGYFEKFIKSNEKSALSFALICPGVAFFVFGMFFINLGLTYNEIITKYSVVYYLLMIPFIYVQIKTIVLFFRLYKKFSL